MKNFKPLLLILLLAVSALYFSGCATVPTREAFPSYDINGVNYLPLVTLCDLKGISWEYDTFTRSITLSKDSHKINLMVGDSLILVDSNPVHLKNPVDIYQGIVVVPRKFKEQILDVLFKEIGAGRKPVFSASIIKKIVIDPGHGGYDPGTTGRSGLREKDVNLDIAKRVASLLKSDGFEVILTRSTDTFIPLNRRAEIANDAKANLFVSIHSNANRVRSLNGFEVYYVGTNVSDTKRALLAAKSDTLNIANARFASQDLDIKAIVWDLIYTYSRAESIELSHSICRIMSSNLDCHILGVKGARFEVLREAQMPAILIEVGFLSNHGEESKLKNGFYRQKLAETIVQGIEDYSKDVVLTQAR